MIEIPPSFSIENKIRSQSVRALCLRHTESKRVFGVNQFLVNSDPSAVSALQYGPMGSWEAFEFYPTDSKDSVRSPAHLGLSKVFGDPRDAWQGMGLDAAWSRGRTSASANHTTINDAFATIESAISSGSWIDHSAERRIQMSLRSMVALDNCQGRLKITSAIQAILDHNPLAAIYTQLCHDLLYVQVKDGQNPVNPVMSLVFFVNGDTATAPRCNDEWKALGEVLAGESAQPLTTALAVPSADSSPVTVEKALHFSSPESDKVYFSVKKGARYFLLWGSRTARKFSKKEVSRFEADAMIDKKIRKGYTPISSDVFLSVIEKSLP